MGDDGEGDGPQYANDQQEKLYYAAIDGNTEEVVRLVREGLAHPNQPWIDSGGDGRLPLCDAALNGHTDTVEALVSLNADVHRAESGGARHTPLTLAARWGHTDTVAKLLALGARPSQRNGEGQSPRELALLLTHPQTASVLEQAERRQEALCAAAQAGRTAWRLPVACGCGIPSSAPEPSSACGEADCSRSSTSASTGWV